MAMAQQVISHLIKSTQNPRVQGSRKLSHKRVATIYFIYIYTQPVEFDIKGIGGCAVSERTSLHRHLKMDFRNAISQLGNEPRTCVGRYSNVSARESNNQKKIIQFTVKTRSTYSSRALRPALKQVVCFFFSLFRCYLPCLLHPLTLFFFLNFIWISQRLLYGIMFKYSWASRKRTPSQQHSLSC